MSGFHRPARAAIPAYGWTVIGGLRPLAAHLVQAPALAMSLVSPILDKAARVVVRSTLTLIMNDVSVSEQGAVIGIEPRHFAEVQIMNEQCGRVCRTMRTAG